MEEVVIKGNDVPFDPTKFDGNYPVSLYNVMLIVRDDSVACREGIGKCHIDAFNRGCPTLKRITLG